MCVSAKSIKYKFDVSYLNMYIYSSNSIGFIDDLSYKVFFRLFIPSSHIHIAPTTILNISTNSTHFIHLEDLTSIRSIMSETVTTYAVILHVIKTDIATHRSSREGGFLDLEKANNAARTLVLRQSDLLPEDWDEYNEDIDDEGEITIHGAIDTMQIVCFVWTTKNLKLAEEIDQVKDMKTQLPVIPRETRSNKCASLARFCLSAMGIYLVIVFVLACFHE